MPYGGFLSNYEQSSVIQQYLIFSNRYENPSGDMVLWYLWKIDLIQNCTFARNILMMCSLDLI